MKEQNPGTNNESPEIKSEIKVRKRGGGLINKKNAEAPKLMPFQPRDTLHPPTFFSVSSIKRKKGKGIIEKRYGHIERENQ